MTCLLNHIGLFAILPAIRGLISIPLSINSFTISSLFLCTIGNAKLEIKSPWFSLRESILPVMFSEYVIKLALLIAEYVSNLSIALIPMNACKSVERTFKPGT